MRLPIKAIGHNTQRRAQKSGLESTSIWFSEQISTALFPGQFSDFGDNKADQKECVLYGNDFIFKTEL